MESESLVLNLGSQAAAALAVLTMARCTLPFPERVPATLRAAAESARSRQLWRGMKQRWLPASTSSGHGG